MRVPTPAAVETAPPEQPEPDAVDAPDATDVTDAADAADVGQEIRAVPGLVILDAGDAEACSADGTCW
jgi:hypothetical protein